MKKWNMLTSSRTNKITLLMATLTTLPSLFVCLFFAVNFCVSWIIRAGVSSSRTNLWEINHASLSSYCRIAVEFLNFISPYTKASDCHGICLIVDKHSNRWDRGENVDWCILNKFCTFCFLLQYFKNTSFLFVHNCYINVASCRYCIIT